ncbi:tail fiber domain-containing protein, partial [Cronobacter turicensis]|nr:tail fiber domain-containing protein [Cronobacter turicensis]
RASKVTNDDSVRSNVIYTNIVGTDGTVRLQAEFWCDTSAGSVSIVNRNPTGQRFLTIRKNGELNPSGRIISEAGAEFKHNGEVLTLRPSAAGQAAYMLIRDYDNSNVFGIGKGSASSYDTTLVNYKYGTQIIMQENIIGFNKDIYAGIIESRRGLIYSKASEASGHAIYYLTNVNGRNRGAVWCPSQASQGQVIGLRADNEGTGVNGQMMLFNGATGEARCIKFTATSDERAKFWIKPVERALDKLCQLRGVTYSMHTTIQNTSRNAGLIAQDVQKVLPEAVTECQADTTTIDKECRTIENPLAVDYNALAALYVEAFKEVRAEMDALKSELEEMKATLASLTASGDTTTSE